MNWGTLRYILLPLLSCLASFLLAITAWRRRDVAGARAFTLMLISGMIWSLGSVVETALPGLHAKIFWDNIQFIGMDLLGPATLIFALQFTGHHRLLKCPLFITITLMFLADQILVWTDPLHGAVRPEAWLEPLGPFTALVYDWGWWAWVNILYNLALVGGSFILLGLHFIHQSQVYRLQAGAVIVGLALPWLGGVATMAGLFPNTQRDAFPVLFGAGSLVLAWGLFRWRLFDIVPVAYNTLMKSMGDGLIVLDSHNRVIDLNPAAAAIFAGSSYLRVGDVIDQHLPELAEVLVGEAGLHRVYQCRETGRYYDIRSSLLPSRRGQRPAGTLIVLRDITKREHLQAELQASEMKYRSVVERAMDGIIIIKNLMIFYCNPQFAAMLGYEPAELEGQAFPQYIDQNDRAFVLTRYEGRLKGETVPERYEFRLLHRSGSTIKVQINAGVIDYGDQRVTLVFIRDVSDYQEVERQRLELEMQRWKNEMLRMFISDVSHDFKTPITVLKTNLHLLGLRGGDEKTRRWISTASEKVDLLQKIVDGMLVMSQLQTTVTFRNHLTGRELNDLIAGLVREQRMVAVARDQSLIFEADPDLPGIEIDQAMLLMALRNLLENAIRYTPDAGKIEVVTGTCAQDVYIGISDSGCGISDDDLPHIFDRFYRGASHRPSDGGLGLGLSIARSIVEAHGGQILVESIQGEGSIFCVKIPVHIPEN